MLDTLVDVALWRFLCLAFLTGSAQTPLGLRPQSFLHIEERGSLPVRMSLYDDSVYSGLPPNMPASERTEEVIEDSLGRSLIITYGKDVIEQLAMIGVRPADIDLLICTHYDDDHAGDRGNTSPWLFSGTTAYNGRRSNSSPTLSTNWTCLRERKASLSHAMRNEMHIPWAERAR